MWTWKQTGTMIAPDGDEFPGYSGHGDGVNNPGMQSVPNVGPIPCGDYTIGLPYHDPKTGPESLPLAPYPDNEMFGRFGFLIHGDLIGHVGQCLASDGCIILPPVVRELIAASGDKLLKVVSGLEASDVV